MAETTPAADTLPNPPGSKEITVEVFGVTDVGRVRKNNQDYFALMDLSTSAQGTGPEIRNHRIGAKGTLFLVSDGMGGEAAGDVASRRSVETIIEEMAKWSPDGKPDAGLSFVHALEAAVQKGNEVVSRESDENPAFRGMGATMTAAGVHGGALYVVQVGDSRCYLRQGARLFQVTRDQSLVGQLLAEGRITKEEAERHPHRNIILQALGKAPTIHAEVVKLPLKKGDQILLCSDGLSGLVRDEEILLKLRGTPDLEPLCHALVQMANDRGGSDNITAVVGRFAGDLPEPSENEERKPIVLAEFSFAGEEEEETQETVVAAEESIFVPEAEEAATEGPAPPYPPVLPSIAMVPPPRPPAGIAVSGLVMVLVLVSGMAVGYELTRLFGPSLRPPLPLPVGWQTAPLAPHVVPRQSAAPPPPAVDEEAASPLPVAGEDEMPSTPSDTSAQRPADVASANPMPEAASGAPATATDPTPAGEPTSR